MTFAPWVGESWIFCGALTTAARSKENEQWPWSNRAHQERVLHMMNNCHFYGELTRPLLGALIAGFGECNHRVCRFQSKMLNKPAGKKNRASNNAQDRRKSLSARFFSGCLSLQTTSQKGLPTMIAIWEKPFSGISCVQITYMEVREHPLT